MRKRPRAMPTFAALLAAALFAAPALAISAAPAPAVTAAPEETPAAAPRAPGPPPTRLFNVVMVLAEEQGQSSSAGLPESARKAIEDLKDFLPYRAYKLLDTALMRTARGATTRLKDPEGGEYDVRLDYRQGEGEQEIFINNFMVRQLPPNFPHVKEMGPIEGKGAPSMKFTEPAAAPRVLIETSFGMRLGETLVVGSSRLNGGKTALILLLTAVE